VPADDQCAEPLQGCSTIRHARERVTPQDQSLLGWRDAARADGLPANEALPTIAVRQQPWFDVIELLARAMDKLDNGHDRHLLNVNMQCTSSLVTNMRNGSVRGRGPINLSSSVSRCATAYVWNRRPENPYSPISSPPAGYTAFYTLLSIWSLL